MIGVIMNYLRHMPRGEICFDFAALYDGEVTFEEEIVSLGGRVYHIGSPSDLLRCRRSLCECIKASGKHYDAIHYHPIYASVLFSGIACKFGIRHTIQHSHSTHYSDRIVPSMRNRLLSYLIPHCATNLAACSTEAARLLRPKGHDVFIMPNAVELSRFRYNSASRAAVRRELSLGSAPTVGHIGRFSPEKNHRFLLRAFADARRQIPELRLVLVGDGELRREIEADIRRLALSDSVRLVGLRRDVPRLLSAFDLFVLPSVFEGVPVAAVEAQASGLPCILGDALTRDVDGGDAVYLPIDDHARWGEAMAAVVLGSPPRRGARPGTLCSFDIAESADALLEYYESFGLPPAAATKNETRGGSVQCTL